MHSNAFCINADAWHGWNPIKGGSRISSKVEGPPKPNLEAPEAISWCPQGQTWALQQTLGRPAYDIFGRKCCLAACSSPACWWSWYSRFQKYRAPAPRHFCTFPFQCASEVRFFASNSCWKICHVVGSLETEYHQGWLCHQKSFTVMSWTFALQYRLYVR